MKQKTLYFKVYDKSFSEINRVKGIKTESGVYIIKGNEYTKKQIKKMTKDGILCRISKRNLVKEYLETL